MSDRRPSIVVVSGPSGSGKTTLIQRALAAGGCRLAVSATTRPKRAGEIDGVHYRFVDHDTFSAWRAGDELLEWAEVYGQFYGTPRGEVQSRDGEVVLLDVDTQGWAALKDRVTNSLAVFIRPPDLESLEARLRARGTEDDATITRRLAAAQAEMDKQDSYHVVLINHELEVAAQEFLRLLGLADANESPLPETGNS